MNAYHPIVQNPDGHLGYPNYPVPYPLASGSVSYGDRTLTIHPESNLRPSQGNWPMGWTAIHGTKAIRGSRGLWLNCQKISGGFGGLGALLLLLLLQEAML